MDDLGGLGLEHDGARSPATDCSWQLRPPPGRCKTRLTATQSLRPGKITTCASAYALTRDHVTIRSEVRPYRPLGASHVGSRYIPRAGSGLETVAGQRELTLATSSS